MEIYIIIILLLVLLYKIQFSACKGDEESHKHTDSYFNIKLDDICRNVNSNIEETASNGQKVVNKEKEVCEKQLLEEKKRYNNLKLDYADKDSNALDFLYQNNDDYPLQGDDKLMYKMYEMGKKNKQAMINRAMWNKNSFLPYIEEELQSHAASIWWDDETLENEF